MFFQLGNHKKNLIVFNKKTKNLKVTLIIFIVSFSKIVKTFLYNCERMYMYMFFQNFFIGNLHNFLRFRVLFGIILRVMLSEKIHEVVCTFVKKKYYACTF